MKKTNKQFLNEVKQKTGNEYLFHDDYVNSKTKLSVTHKVCGYKYKTTPDNFLNSNSRCPVCKKNYKNNDIFQKEVLEDTKGEYICYDNYISKRHRLKFLHRKCGAEFMQHPENFLKGYRCPRCGLKNRSGKNHYKYNESLTFKDRSKRDMFNGDIKKWRNQVFSRDNYTCVLCTNQGVKLNAHHLESWNSNKDLRFCVSNGVTLCEICHREFHKLYGYGNNTKEQFFKFKDK